MKRFLIAALMALTAGAALTAPAAAQATVLSGSSAAAVSHGAAPGRTLAAPASSGAQRWAGRVTLSPAQCAALRRSLHRAAANCTVIETLHLTARPGRASTVQKAVGLRVASSSSDIYLNGFLQACAALTSGGSCNTSNWWVDDWFAATYSGSQVWNNGTPHCTSNHTNVTWCSYVGNGTSVLQEGFNFGNNGYARLHIDAGFGTCYVYTNSYSYPYGDEVIGGSSYECYYSGIPGGGTGI
jgi:hypothetical protein